MKRMDRRLFLTSLAVVPLAAIVAACGDPNEQPVTTEPTTPGTTPVTAPTGIVHPTGADDVVLKVSYEGGLVPAGYFFASVPALLVSGDGRAFSSGPVPAIYPGPLLPNILVRSIGEDGVQSVLRIAADAGLLASPPDYSGGDNVADAPDTVVTINAANEQFVHSAYALGIGQPESASRQNLLDAVNRLTALSDAGAATFAAETYRLRARAVDPAELTSQDLPPTVVDWPVDSNVVLADATDCARVAASAVGSLFTDAKQNTYFKEGDVVYQLSVRGVLPGDPAC